MSIIEKAKKQKKEIFKEFQASKQIMTVEEFNNLTYGFCDPETHPQGEKGIVYVYDECAYIEVHEDCFYLIVDRSEYKVETIAELEDLEWILYDWAVEYS